MFSKIPWSTFLFSLAGLLGGYYLVIGFLFYRKDLRSWLLRRRTAADNAVEGEEGSRERSVENE
jgi:hypothetical protein